MLIWYDWEFLEDGVTIEPISLGMVAEDGRELYCVNRDAAWDRVAQHPWLMANVVPHLPFSEIGRRAGLARGYCWVSAEHPDAGAVVPLDEMRRQVAEFLDAARPVELWGYYAAYDHVRLAQLFGPMVDRPEAMPMFTHDLMQLLGAKGLTENDLPAAPGDAHNALSDARWTRDAYLSVIDR